MQKMIKLYNALWRAINAQNHDEIVKISEEMFRKFEDREVWSVGWQKPKLTGNPDTDAHLLKLDPYLTGDRPQW